MSAEVTKDASTEGRVAELYTRHSPTAQRLAFLLTGDRARAEDLVQEAFVRVVGRFGHLRVPDAFEAHLRRTIVNVIAAGTAGGQPWELIATLDGRELGLTLSSPGRSSGMGGLTRDPEGVEFSSESFGEGGARQVVVFGVVPGPTMRVEVVSAVGAARSGRVVDVPEPISGPLNAFVVAYHPDPVDPAPTLNAYDEDGRLVATAAITPTPEGAAVPVAPSPGEIVSLTASAEGE